MKPFIDSEMTRDLWARIMSQVEALQARMGDDGIRSVDAIFDYSHDHAAGIQMVWFYDDRLIRSSLHDRVFGPMPSALFLDRVEGRPEHVHEYAGSGYVSMNEAAAQIIENIESFVDATAPAGFIRQGFLVDIATNAGIEVTIFKDTAVPSETHGAKQFDHALLDAGINWVQPDMTSAIEVVQDDEVSP